MMVKLYADWDNGTIINEKRAKENVWDEYYPNATSQDNFNEWLSENYSHVDLFNMSEDEKKIIQSEFREEMEDTAWQDFLADGYEEVSVEI